MEVQSRTTPSVASTSPRKEQAKPHELKTNYEDALGSEVESISLEKPLVVLVDPFSTGANLAQEFYERNAELIIVYSSQGALDSLADMKLDTISYDAATEIVHTSDDIEELVQKIRAFEDEANTKVSVVVPGCESGVDLAEALAHSMGFSVNNIEHSRARRDKYLMGETVREAGVRAVIQAKCTKMEQLEEFIASMPQDPFKCIVKPIEAAGSEDVTLCHSPDEARAAFNHIVGKTNCVGLVNEGVLAQEYLEGTEYVIDTVSLNGKHKVTAVWEYDKREANGGAFVYFGMRLVPYSERVQEMIDYHLQVLDALGFKYGAGHGEVKFCRGAPVLIEVGARCQGGEGLWTVMADRCLGYNQVGAVVDAYLDEAKFNAIPDVPKDFKAHGLEFIMVNYKEGILKSVPGLKELEESEYYVSKMLLVKEGDNLPKSYDLLTSPGSVMLVHEDREKLNEIYDAAHEKCRKNEFFELE